MGVDGRIRPPALGHVSIHLPAAISCLLTSGAKPIRPSTSHSNPPYPPQRQTLIKPSPPPAITVHHNRPLQPILACYVFSPPCLHQMVSPPYQNRPHQANPAHGSLIQLSS